MNKTDIVNRDEFLEVMRELKKQFGAAKTNVEIREREFDEHLRQLIDFLKNQPLALPRGGESLGVSLSQELQKLRDYLTKVVVDWGNQVAKYERNTEFRRDHEDSLLVYIYGVVKSGKSSLGNFIAHGCSAPSDEFISELSSDSNVPKFFVRAVASEKEAEIREADQQIARSCRFHSDVMEATGCIQGFKLPGLTWIDSPGLGSMTEANGKLARAYVDSSDLVLITMHSDHPGRRDEMDEIRELMRDKNSVMVLLTVADELERDCDDGETVKEKLIMKSADERKQMVDYVASEINKMIGKNRETPKIIPISVKYAEKHPDSVGFDESGLSELFARLREIAKGNGVENKRNIPNNNFHNFIRDFVGETREFSVGKMLGIISSFERTLAQSREVLDNQIRQAEDQANRAVKVMIEQEVENHRSARDSKGLQDTVERRFREKAKTHLLNAADEIEQHINTEFRALDRHDPGAILEFKPITEVVNLTINEKTLWGPLVGAAVGGASGALIGGLPGASAGAGIGMAAGSAVYGTRKRTIRRHVEIGDNTNELISELVKHYQSALQDITNIIRQNFDEIWQHLEILVKNIVSEIGAFKAKWTKEMIR